MFYKIIQSVNDKEIRVSSGFNRMANLENPRMQSNKSALILLCSYIMYCLYN
jgi:hypothetical protein